MNLVAERNLVRTETGRWTGAVIVGSVAALMLLWTDSLIALLAFAVAANPSWPSKAWALLPVLVLVTQAAWLRQTWRRGREEETTTRGLVARLAVNTILVALASLPVAMLALIA